MLRMKERQQGTQRQFRERAASELGVGQSSNRVRERRGSDRATPIFKSYCCPCSLPVHWVRYVAHRQSRYQLAPGLPLWKVLACLCLSPSKKWLAQVQGPAYQGSTPTLLSCAKVCMAPCRSVKRSRSVGWRGELRVACVVADGLALSRVLAALAEKQTQTPEIDMGH